jgi:DNA-binding transcriptional regulator YiaG
VKKFLKGWGYNLTGSRKKRKKEILEALLELEEAEEMGPLDVEQLRNRIDMKTELFAIFDEELH